MKVLLVEAWAHGGTARYAAELALALTNSAASQDSVELLAPGDFTDGRPPVRRALPVLGARARSSFGRAASLVRRRNAISRAISREVRGVHPEIVHLLGTATSSTRVRQATRAEAAKLVVTVHDIPVSGAGLAQLWFGVASRGFTRADAVVVHGDWSRRELAARYPRDHKLEVHVIPHGPYYYGATTADRNAVRRRYGLPAETPVALFFGALRRNKGLETAIRALATNAGADLRLFVVGERPAGSEPSIDEWKALADRLHVGERVTWVPRYVPDSEVPDVFAAADVTALPYDASFSGQSGVLHVAAAHGVPVVASDVGEIGATVREHNLGVVVAPGSPTAFAAALTNVANAVQPLKPGPSVGWPDIARLHWDLYRRLTQPA